MSWPVEAAMTDLARDTDEVGLWRDAGVATARHARAAYARLSSDWALQERASSKSIIAAPDPAAGRVASVDALRGFAMFWLLAGDAFAWALYDMASGKEGRLIAA